MRRRFLSRPRVGRLALLAFGLPFIVPVSPADATPPSPPPTTTSALPTRGTPLSDPLARAVGLAVEGARDSAALATVTQALAAVETRLIDLSARVDGSQGDLAAAQASLAATVTRLHRRAAASYRMYGAPMASVLELHHVQSLATAEQYINAAAVADSSDVARLKGVVADLTLTRDSRVAEQRELTARETQLAARQTALAASAAFAQATLAKLGGVPVMGESRLTADQLTAWYESTGQHAHLPDGTTIADLAQFYIDEGAAENVRGDLAFAQSIEETGSFRETRGNNYSGIGNCDSCGEKGMAFPTPRDGVRAQIQLLRNYADPSSRAANLAHPPDSTLYGPDPARAARTYDRFFLKGKVPLWNQMGNGNWATSTTYATKVLTIYARMLAFASQHPVVPSSAAPSDG